MKKFKKFLSLFLVLAVFLTGIIIPPQEAHAKTKKYVFYGCYVKTFKKTNGKLLIQTVKDTGHGGYEPISLKLKPAKNIKYFSGYYGENNKFVTESYYKFNDLKKMFAEAYAEYKREKEYFSPPEVTVYVKNNKIEKIRLAVP